MSADLQGEWLGAWRSKQVWNLDRMVKMWLSYCIRNHTSRVAVTSWGQGLSLPATFRKGHIDLWHKWRRKQLSFKQAAYLKRGLVSVQQPCMWTQSAGPTIADAIQEVGEKTPAMQANQEPLSTCPYKVQWQSLVTPTVTPKILNIIRNHHHTHAQG